MAKKTNLIITVLVPVLSFTLIDFKIVMAKDSDGQKGGGGYYDAGILENGSSSTPKNGNKKKKHHHGKKKNKSAVNQNPAGPQEDVTDQKEVSEQADQSNSKYKK